MTDRAALAEECKRLAQRLRDGDWNLRSPQEMADMVADWLDAAQEGPAAPAPEDVERLALWLDAKWERHREYEDKEAADMLRRLAAGPAAPAEPVALPGFIRRDVERAIAEAVNPGGMSVHDGTARIGADRLTYMLRLIDSLAAHPAGSPPEPLLCGHPASLAIMSAETPGKFLYCELCDNKSGRRDAETREAELQAKVAEAEETIRHLIAALRDATEAPAFDPEGPRPVAATLLAPPADSLGATPAGSGSAGSAPSPSVSALRAPIPGAEEFVRMLLWDEFPECCGCPVVGAEYMGAQEQVCCGNPEPALLSDAQIVASLRERFPATN